MPRKTAKPTKNTNSKVIDKTKATAATGTLTATKTSSSTSTSMAVVGKTSASKSVVNNNNIDKAAAAAAAAHRTQESMSSADSDMSTETSPSMHAESALPSNDSGKDSLPFSDRPSSTPLNMAAVTQTTEMMVDSACSQSPRNSALTASKSPTPEKIVSESRGHPERKRRASNESEDSAVTKTSESGAVDDLAGSKDEDDDDNDDDDEKGPPGQHWDPERLKAFNMFVRLFVDENLDRVVPISKQPKDKIQAILEACDRQFPEFHERSRKRIRTYLKSCRRMRRSKEQNGWEPQLRPTPPHLTSAAAEGLLAAACENESQNAKRMRMGLEPLPASLMNVARELGGAAATLLPAPPLPATVTPTPISTQAPATTSITPTPTPQQQQTTSTSSSSSSTTTTSTSTASQQTSTTPNSLLTDRASTTTNNNNNSVAVGVATADFLRGHSATTTPQPPPPPPVFRAAPSADFPSFFTNGNGLFRASAAGFSYQHPAHHHPPTATPASLLQQQQQHPPPRLSGSAVTNGDFVPTDLSMKKTSSKNQLSATEVTTIKQLIAGYRESAAFLYRSADELEQLLLQQN